MSVTDVSATAEYRDADIVGLRGLQPIVRQHRLYNITKNPDVAIKTRYSLYSFCCSTDL